MRKKSLIYVIILMICVLFALPTSAQKRPMTFMDILKRPQVSMPELSPDGKWAVYSISRLDWEKSERFNDIYLVSTDGKTTRQITYTPDKNEAELKFTPCSKGITFTSDREGKKHLYFIWIDGGEARNVTSKHEGGIGKYAWSEDGKWIAYTVKEKDLNQLWIIPGDGSGEAKQLTKHESTVDIWVWGVKSDRIYFTAPDWDDEIDRKRKEKKFDVDIKNEIGVPNHIWEVDIKTGVERALTSGRTFSELSRYILPWPKICRNFTLSKDGRWMGITRYPYKRYLGFFDKYFYGDLYLIDLRTGNTERLTDNEIFESSLMFTHNSKYMGYTMQDDGIYRHNTKLYVKPVQGGEWRKLLANEDINYNPAFFAQDNKTYYMVVGEGVRQNVFKSSIESDRLERITDLEGVIQINYNEKNDKVIISYTDPKTPVDYYIADVEDLPDKNRWVRLTHSDPEVKNFLLPDCETIRWKSKDGTMIEGLLWTPPGLDPDRRYPLIVQVHGGPASASMRRFFSWVNYVQVYTGNGYVVFQPNYRGSTNYGQHFRIQIAGNYFQKGFEDIMTGVDYLIRRGIAHPDSLGLMGWSAGGHFSNWALVKTDRFKAISSGAGGMNWVSMYAQTDTKAAREFYYVDTPYNNYEGYWNVSPLKYIKNAKTPTLIHCGEKDQRVPRPQSEELYVALQKLGVPSEFIVYPNTLHNLKEARHQLVKMISEFNWFEKWIRDSEGWFEWKEMLDTLKKEKK